MKRFVLSKKKLTAEEADKRIQALFQKITIHIDNINYWKPKIGKKLEFIDMFILGVDKIKSPEEFIKMSQEEIDYCMRKIYEDYGRFTKVKNKIL